MGGVRFSQCVDVLAGRDSDPDRRFTAESKGQGTTAMEENALG